MKQLVSYQTGDAHLAKQYLPVSIRLILEINVFHYLDRVLRSFADAWHMD